MEEQTWFEKKRADMLADIPHKTLHSQIFVNFDYDDLMEIDEILERFNTEKSKHLDKYHGIGLPGIEDELSYATVAEAVYEFDKLTLKKIISKSTRKQVKLPEGEYLGDRFGYLDKHIFIYYAKTKPIINDETISNCFIIASPLIISILQAASKTMFHPAIESTFKGPNNTMLVGNINDINIYSYIFRPDDEMEIIMGYNDPDNPKDYHSQILIVDNLMP